MKRIIIVLVALFVSFPAHAGKKKHEDAQVTYARMMNYYHRICGNTEDVEMYIGTTAEEVEKTCRQIQVILTRINRASRKKYKKRKKVRRRTQ